MKTQVIPAQITTVEDKIAGNLSLTQLLLLISPVFFAAFVYSVFPPTLAFVWYKLPFVVIGFIVCPLLALRIKGKTLLHWLLVIASYNLRPKYYVFNKNDKYLRDITLPTVEKKQRVLFKKSHKTKTREKTNFSILDLARLENLIASSKYSLSLKTEKKGGLSVAFEQEQK